MVISLLQAENISKSFGDLLLFQDISLSIEKDQKIALIAKNGTGKTTLLNILAGLDVPDNGLISKRNDISIGYLNQNPEFDPHKTVLEQALSLENEICKTIQRYELLLHSEDKTGLGQVMQEMDALQAWDYDVRMKQILGKLGFASFDMKIGHLSGGQKKRLALATVLIQTPDLLILDEPTNHLDLEMIEWLEQFLKSTSLTLFMVTHDRYFLDRVCNEIIELEDLQLYTYKGNYSYFLEKRELRLQNLQANIERSKNLFKKELEWMRRMPQARTTKSKSRIESFYDLKEEAARRIKEKQINLNIKTERLGKKILELHYISKAYNETLLFKDFQYKFTRGEKIGIVGRNGCGKSTLLNIITQTVKPDTGSLETGETVKYGYYKQDGIQFNETIKVIEVVREFAEIVILGDGRKMSISQFLQYFLFSPDMHYLPVSKLSGGEKRRLYLLTILMQNPNFLILDEPTNDLDIMTLSVLEDYLQHYPGCVMIVSHDRYFLDKIVDHIFAFEGDGKIRDYPGNYSLYREFVQNQEANSSKIASKEQAAKPKYNLSSRKFSFKDKHEFEKLDQELKSLNEKKEALEMELKSDKIPLNDLLLKTNQLGQLIDLIDSKEIRWLELDELINA